MIDLLPAPEKNAIRKEYRLRVFTVCFAMLSLVFTIMIISFLPTHLFVISRYEAFLTESESDETQSQLSLVKDRETTVRDTNKKIEILKIGAGTARATDIILNILASKSNGVVITGLTYDFGGVISKKAGVETSSPPSVGITGRSADRAALLAFRDALARRKEFGAVDLPISSLVKDTDLTFSLNLVLTPAAPGKIQ
jgi:hypothetical protein